MVPIFWAILYVCMYVYVLQPRLQDRSRSRCVCRATPQTAVQFSLTPLRSSSVRQVLVLTTSSSTVSKTSPSVTWLTAPSEVSTQATVRTLTVFFIISYLLIVTRSQKTSRSRLRKNISHVECFGLKERLNSFSFRRRRNNVADRTSPGWCSGGRSPMVARCMIIYKRKNQCFYPVPDRSGDGILFSIDFFVYIFLSFFVYLLARLRKNGWTDLHEIFREGVEWP